MNDYCLKGREGEMEGDPVANLLWARMREPAEEQREDRMVRAKDRSKGVGSGLVKLSA